MNREADSAQQALRAWGGLDQPTPYPIAVADQLRAKQQSLQRELRATRSRLRIANRAIENANSQLLQETAFNSALELSALKIDTVRSKGPRESPVCKLMRRARRMRFAAPRPLRRLPALAVLAVHLFACVAVAAEAVPEQRVPEDIDQDTSIAIAENMQDAILLRRLLMGRQFALFGRVEGEFALYDIPVFLDENDAELRRLRLGLAGLNPWFENISYKVEFDYSDGSGNLSDAYFAVDLGPRGALTIGNQDGSQSLSASTGSLSQLFMESPLPISTFGLDKRIGVAYDRFAERAGMHLLLFGRDLNNPDAEHRGLALRAYFNPYRSAGGVWHLGASGVRENIDDSVRLRTRPESHVTDIRLVDTGVREDVERSTRLGFEAAGASGSFTTRLELLVTEWQRRDGSRNRFAGAYLEGGYFLTGEPFRYRDGKFLRPALEGGQDAWELAYRWSWVDLDDGDVQGGEERNLGLALNYYPAPRARGQLNLIQVNSERAGGDGLLFQARIQLNW